MGRVCGEAHGACVLRPFHSSDRPERGPGPGEDITALQPSYVEGE